MLVQHIPVVRNVNFGNSCCRSSSYHFRSGMLGLGDLSEPGQRASVSLEYGQIKRSFSHTCKCIIRYIQLPVLRFVFSQILIFIMEHLHTNFIEESLTPRNVFASAFTVFVAYFIFSFLLDNKSIPGFGIAGKKDGEWINMKARHRFTMNSKGIVQDGIEKVMHQVIYHGINVADQLLVQERHISGVCSFGPTTHPSHQVP